MLDPKPGESFIDATVNGGGHAKAILDRVGATGKVLGIDADSGVLEKLKLEARNWKLETRLVLVHDSYVNLVSVAAEHGFEKVDGVLFDLGMSNWHIEESGRGFSFLRDEPLDMRYDPEQGETATELIIKSSEADLERIMREYGEERFAPAIARAIIQSRQNEPLLRTSQLVEIIKHAVPMWYRNRRAHFATKTFQSLRIAANHEFENIENGINQSINIVVPGGRIAIITFHSLEDRLVKNLFKTKAKEGVIELINKKAIRPSWPEIVANRKARSAKLRAVRKVMG